MARFGEALVAGADLVRAAEAAAARATAPLRGKEADLACVFVCGDDTDAVAAALERAAEITGARSAIGCSASGVIGSSSAVEGARSVSVWCAVLPDVRVRTFHLEVLPADAGMAVVGMPERRPDDSVGILLADPWSFPVDGFVGRTNEALHDLPFVGGLAVGSRGRGSTRLLFDGAVVDRGAVGAFLAGPVAGSAFVSQGCRPVGAPMTVTAADGNVALELAGVPALGKLEEVLGALPPADQALASTGLHLGLAMDEYAEEHEHGDFVVRAVVGVDDIRKGLIIGDLLELGQTVQFHVRDARTAHDDLELALQRFRSHGPFDTVESALLFSCNGRGAATFERADHDVAVVSAGLAVDEVSGFFAAGEIGPVGGRNYVHGFTAAVLAFGSGSGAVRGTRGQLPR